MYSSTICLGVWAGLAFIGAIDPIGTMPSGRTNRENLKKLSPLDIWLCQGSVFDAVETSPSIRASTAIAALKLEGTGGRSSAVALNSGVHTGAGTFMLNNAPTRHI